MRHVLHHFAGLFSVKNDGFRWVFESKHREIPHIPVTVHLIARGPLRRPGLRPGLSGLKPPAGGAFDPRHESLGAQGPADGFIVVDRDVRRLGKQVRDIGKARQHGARVGENQVARDFNSVERPILCPFFGQDVLNLKPFGDGAFFAFPASHTEFKSFQYQPQCRSTNGFVRSLRYHGLDHLRIDWPTSRGAGPRQ